MSEEFENKDYSSPFVRKKQQGRVFVKGVIILILALAVNVALFMLVVDYAVNKKMSEYLTAVPSVEAMPNYTVSLPREGSYVARSEGELTNMEIAEMVSPAVVGISSSREVSTFFGKSTEEGSGSGIIIRSDGYIVTNNHVVEKAEVVKVILISGEEYTAKVVGTDAKTDLAVLKVEATDLPIAVLGTSNELRVGEPVMSIGNPLGQKLAGSVTVGVVSALNRSLNVDGRQFTLIQSDAAINPGNSGGALLNSYGEVVGINSVKVLSADGLGFAIPIDIAKPIIDDLIAFGYVKGRPIIGITQREVTAYMAQAYNMPQGVYVVDVAVGSGAEKAGIKAGDVIVEAEGVEVKGLPELNEVKDKFKAGDSMAVKVSRDTGRGHWETLEMVITLGEEKGEGR